MGELTPYLAVTDGHAALAWYVDRLGAELTSEPILMPDGSLGHAELVLHGAAWMLSQEHPELHVEAPEPGRGASVTLHLGVDEPGQVDELASRAAAGGALLDRGPEDSDYGRMAVVRDPFGHRWMLNHDS